METNNSLKALFFISFIMIFIGAYFKIMHWGYSEEILIIGLLLSLAYVILGIIEVNNSTKIEKSEKMIWTVGFIFLGSVTALVYLFSGRKRII